MQRWEYLTRFVEADVRNQAMDTMYSELVDVENLPRYSPLAMIPELNRLGEKGWELVHMQPVYIGNNHDVLIQEGGGMKRWATNYFCVFKRPA
jgi:hypothetical protein